MGLQRERGREMKKQTDRERYTDKNIEKKRKKCVI